MSYTQEELNAIKQAFETLCDLLSDDHIRGIAIRVNTLRRPKDQDGSLDRCRVSFTSREIIANFSEWYGGYCENAWETRIPLEAVWNPEFLAKEAARVEEERRKLAEAEAARKEALEIRRKEEAEKVERAQYERLKAKFEGDCRMAEEGK